MSSALRPSVLLRRAGELLPALAAVVFSLFVVTQFTSTDSTQPRGTDIFAANPFLSAQQIDRLSPMHDGLRAPQRIAPQSIYRDWVGSIMGNSLRDPAFWATLNISNQDWIDVLRDLEKNDPVQFEELVEQMGLEGEDLSVDENLPVFATACFRCHGPGGWFEAHAEPASNQFPQSQGDFWGTQVVEHNPSAGYSSGSGYLSEAEMDGVQCDSCHRQWSVSASGPLGSGTAGAHLNHTNPFGDGPPKPKNMNDLVDFDGDGTLDGPPPEAHNGSFQKSAEHCGTCHDVTQTLLATKTVVNGRVPDMAHPLERTFTEWFFSDFRAEGKTCQKCHSPMRFQGAQTWMLDPGIDLVWGDVDAPWKGMHVSDPAFDPTRLQALKEARARNERFMAKKAAKVEILDAPLEARTGDLLSFTVRVTNLTGHKLPTGFNEGRRAWLHVRALDKDTGALLYENGALTAEGCLPGVKKVYRQTAISTFFADDEFVGPCGPSPRGAHHFGMLNQILADNRIPPKGFDKQAYQANGAFILPEDLYDAGQHWDDTSYSFALPEGRIGIDKVQLEAELLYQTFDEAFVAFTDERDLEEFVSDGGRSPDLPVTGSFGEGFDYWGEVLKRVWEEGGNGKPVPMGFGKMTIEIN